MSNETLGQARRRFSLMFAKLILKAFELGYEASIGDVMATDGHKPRSCHYLGLAGDLNLFKDGVYLDKTEHHLVLGEYWESMGGTWGGRFSFGDGNHYSIPWQGMK